MKNIFRKLTLYSVALAAVSFSSCSLEENNPAGFTKENLATSIEGYETLVNQCYFAMERYFYGTDSWMSLTEGDSDLWTYQANQSTSYTQWFWFFAGASPNTTYTNNWWNGTYDGVGSCNEAIALAGYAPYKTEAERNAKVAEARFLRAIYYFNAVEQFGGVTMLTEPETTLNYAPERTDPLTIYKEVIIPDLEYAVEWLAVGTHATTTVPTKKAALGFLAKACLQTYEYGSTEYLQKALDSAKELIADCESGGAKYNAYMYPTYEEVFKESNNWENKEALWKHRWYAGSDGHGSSNGNYKLNRNDEYFLCNVNKFGAREDNQETRLTWEGCISGIFMPTQHLLNLYVQEDGTLDPRFHESFTTEWNANKNYIWDTSAANMYDKDESIVGTELKKGDLAIKFVMPQDEDYAEEKANRHTSNYLMIAYDDVYNDQKHNVNMQYNGMENQFRYFYPSLNKHNSSNYYVANASKKRNGNLNATFMMRMAEVYLIAAEADIYINGGANAMGYINKVRARAGAKALTGTATVRTVLDERGRELCGEYCRFYDLKRTGMFKSSNYLEETHPDLAQFFNPNNNLTAGNRALERTEHPLDAAGKHLRRKGVKPHGLTVDGDFNAPARGHAIAGRLLSSHDALRHGGTVRFPASSAIQRGQQKALLKNQIDQRIQIFGRERRQPGELVVPIRSERQLGAQSLAAFRKRRQKFRGGPQTQDTRQPADGFASFHQQDVRIQQRDQIPEEARMPPMDHGFALAVLRIAQPHDGPFRAHQKRGIRIRLVQFVMGVFGNGDFEASGFQTLGKPGNERRLAGIAEPYDTDGLHTDLLW